MEGHNDDQRINRGKAGRGVVFWGMGLGLGMGMIGLMGPMDVVLLTQHKNWRFSPMLMAQPFL